MSLNDSTRAPEPMHRWSSHDGVRLAGDSWGDPKDTPVILLHGAGQTRHAWRRTGRLLGDEGFFAVAFDARGHGDSDWPMDANYSQSAMVRDLESVVLAVGARRPILVGAATGGATSLLAVGENYIDARALVLINIAPQTEPEGVARVQSFMRQRPDAFDSTDDWDPCFVAWPRDMARRHRRLSACARKLALPTLLLRGERSDVISEAGAAEFLKLCPHARYDTVRHAGHPIGKGNDVFGEAALRFIRDCADGQPPRTRRLYEYA
jgi:pimeloyl-ACP methyl ester carboxylesterase